MSLPALLTFVLPAVVVVAGVTAAAARLSLRLGTSLGLLAALGVAEIVNLVSGTGSGPAARSTFAATVCTALAVAAVLGPVPVLFAAAVVGVVVGALGLGAGAEVAPVAVAAAVVMVVALAVVEAQGRHWTRRPPGLATVLALALVVGVSVAAVATQADRRLAGDPALLAPGAVQPSIRPPHVLSDPNSRPTSSTIPATAGRADPATPKSSGVSLGTIWLGILAALLLLLVVAAMRMLWIALAWRRLRRRLRRGSAQERVAGAWVWSTRRLRAAGWPMPPSLSPDAVSAGQGASELPRSIRSALRQVAGSTVDAVYAPPVGDHDPDVAWVAADEVGHGAVSALRPARRLGFALRSLSSVPTHSAASAPAPLEENRS